MLDRLGWHAVATYVPALLSKKLHSKPCLRLWLQLANHDLVHSSDKWCTSSLPDSHLGYIVKWHFLACKNLNAQINYQTKTVGFGNTPPCLTFIGSHIMSTLLENVRLAVAMTMTMTMTMSIWLWQHPWQYRFGSDQAIWWPFDFGSSLDHYLWQRHIDFCRSLRNSVGHVAIEDHGLATPVCPFGFGYIYVEGRLWHVFYHSIFATSSTVWVGQTPVSSAKTMMTWPRVLPKPNFQGSAAAKARIALPKSNGRRCFQYSKCFRVMPKPTLRAPVEELQEVLGHGDHPGEREHHEVGAEALATGAWTTA